MATVGLPSWDLHLNTRPDKWEVMGPAKCSGPTGREEGCGVLAGDAWHFNLKLRSGS